MSWDLLFQLLFVIIGVGAFVGETRHALKVIGVRLDRIEDRMGRLELCLSRRSSEDPDSGRFPCAVS